VWAAQGKNAATLEAFYDELGESGCAALEDQPAALSGYEILWSSSIPTRSANVLSLSTLSAEGSWAIWILGMGKVCLSAEACGRPYAYDVRARQA
jgi:hypothetical protein